MNRTARPRSRSRARRGMTLIEVMLAIGILVGSMIGLAEFGRRFTKANTRSSLATRATDAAVDQLERVKSERNYATVDSYAGSVALTGIYQGFTQVTQVTRTNNASRDYKTVTVTVSHPALTASVKKTTAIAAF